MDSREDETKSTFWRRLRGHVLRPTVDERALEKTLREVHRRLPVPVVWLFGKAQSGKTSIIRALTGNTKAEIGNGFRACTPSAELYSYPNETECFVRFMDTRGLGEVDYDPSADLKWLEGQTHILLVVVKAMDHAQTAILKPLERILAANSGRPLIVAQTSLHQGYPAGMRQHVMPYPFNTRPYPDSVPRDVARSLEAQQGYFAGRRAKFVPVDFTLPEDAVTPDNYGLEELWQAIDDLLPLGLRYLIQESREARDPLRDVYFQAAHPHIVFHALAAGSVGAVPVPWVDIPAVLVIQSKLFHSIASIYGQTFGGRELTELGSLVGIGSGLRLAVREALKFVPGVGSVAAGVFAGASTYALGCTLCAYYSHLRDGDVPDAKYLASFYRQQYAEGRQRLAAYLSQVAGGRAK